MFKKLCAVAGASALLVAVLGAPAFADDAPPTDVIEAPVAVEETPPAEPEVEAPVTDAPVVPIVEAPVAETPVAPLPEVTAPVVAAKVAPQVAVDPTPFLLIAWQMPSWIDSTTPSWGQTKPITLDLATKDLNALDATLADPQYCSLQFQVDGNFDNAVSRALVAGGHLDGPGNPPEALWGGGWGEAYKLVKTAVCPPPPPAAIPCTPTGDWYTEDKAPILSANGLFFEGSTPQPVNWLHPTGGNFQGFTGATYTLENVAGYQPGYRFVVNPNAGTLHYASVTVEPYISEGWTAGQSGTATVSTSSLAWSSKIPTGPGSQSQPVPLSDFGTIWPNNVFISQGFHLGSTNTSSTYATVTAVTGCLNASFAPVPPEAEVETRTWVEGECSDTAGFRTDTTYGQDTTYQKIWDEQTQRFVNDEGTEGEVYVIGTEQVRDSECDVWIDVQPEAPTYTDECGPDNGVLTVPDDTTAYHYVVTVWDETKATTVEVAENVGYHFSDGIQIAWDFPAPNDAPCPTATPTPSSSATPVVVQVADVDGNLASTDSFEVKDILGLVGIAALAGTVLVMVGRRRKA